MRYTNLGYVKNSNGNCINIDNTLRTTTVVAHLESTPSGHSRILAFGVLSRKASAAFFFRNCIRSGVLPIETSRNKIDRFLSAVGENPKENRVLIDLEAQAMGVESGQMQAFSVAENDRQMLLEGLDQIAETQKLKDEIDAFTARDKHTRPWLS